MPSDEEKNDQLEGQPVDDEVFEKVFEDQLDADLDEKSDFHPQESGDQIVPIPTFRTEDLDQFSYFEGNRNIRNAHVQKIKESMNEIDLHRFRPILVLPDGKVVDGQHRLEARRRMGEPVYYTILDSEDFDQEHISYLQVAREWDLPDYIDLFQTEGNKSYDRWAKLRDAFDWATDSHILGLIAQGGFRSMGIKRFRNQQVKAGNLAINPTEYKEMMVMLSQFDEMAEEADCSKKSFMLGWFNFRDSFDADPVDIDYEHDRMVQQIKKYEPSQDLIEAATKIEQYKDALFELYDFNRRKNLVSDYNPF